ncbi:camphor resistance protein CrcB [Seinonella peptonophila]|uniref:Fluoride-specific ion channel FluC n=1 Tax=Seinonella peptonophila TaxID=112248 RepID=A0A1M4ZJX4_9BACL|nr:fluoride efflux transporter CrcB [Seinonella peptonophila]SHF18112.1 camphor resistance protein CrcB [Seinonella peptonophila]
MSLLFISISGSLGAISRYLLSKRYPFKQFPTTTLLINLSGCFLFGFWLGWIGFQTPPAHPFTTGFLGGYTTFSTFSVEIINLLEKKDLKRAIFYLFASIFGGMVSWAIGYGLARMST